MPRPSLNDINTHLKLIALALGIEKSLSSKSARKTFADFYINEYRNEHKQRLGLDDVSTMMGLSTTRHLNRYCRIDERRLINAMGLRTSQENDNKVN